ncbi:MAG: autotransporter-associated beta strand repeat-containing protein [Marinilabiliaceae bacterium]|nr:autotransporter-associated beta strand repeat-containing protein [Marinilabiliaceae bacterium]
MKKVGLLLLGLLFIGNIHAQRKMEILDRGLVALKTTKGVFASWRIQGYEWHDVTYNIYRDGTKLNTAPLEVSNFEDAGGTTASTYTVSAIVDGKEQAQCDAVSVIAKDYFEIPLVERDSTYGPNDATVADLDGDGEYEIIIKRLGGTLDVDETRFSFFEAYKLDGTLLWAIDVGPNITDHVETNIAAFDFDEDGKAEVYMRTSEGTVFGDGTKIGDVGNALGDPIPDGKTNYRGGGSYITEGPEFLSLINGETGVEMDRVDFIRRGLAIDWGDGYGHRCSKYYFGAPYLDGKKPSIMIGRGIYTKTVIQTFDVVNKKLVFRWEFNTDENPTYFGQGNHNNQVADIDWDGKDEIIWGGSMAVDDDGTGLWNTQLGHGDALHIGDFDPFSKGQEVWKCIEVGEGGTMMANGITGKIQIRHRTFKDCGRCMAGNVTEDGLGAEVWGGGRLYSASSKDDLSDGRYAVSENFRIYWDGDLLEEMVNHNWNGGYSEGTVHKLDKVLLTTTDAYSCNWTKGTPCLQADIFGDWREELIYRGAGDGHIRIYSTTIPTKYRNYTLMHDHQYRQAIVWQMCGYNQPPHTSYFLGEREGCTIAPPPVMTNGRLVYQGPGNWDSSALIWKKDGEVMAFSNGTHVSFDGMQDTNDSIAIVENVNPNVLTVNTQGNYIFSSEGGKITGNTKLVKQGEGSLKVYGNHDFTGITKVWGGELSIVGDIPNSPIWMNINSEMELLGKVKSLSMRYGAKLFVGGENVSGVVTIGDSLTSEEKAQLVFDLYSPNSQLNDSMVINGKLSLADGTVIAVNPKMELVPGDYVLAVVSGEIKVNTVAVKFEGVPGVPCKLKIIEDKLVLTIEEMRSSSTVYWNGNISNEWDLNNTENFLLENNNNVFATGDNVVINDDAIDNTINITENIYPASIEFNNNEDFVIQGKGAISGNTTLTKHGSGTLTINSVNNFTGKMLVDGGMLSISTFPTDMDGNGSIGPISSNPDLFEVNAATINNGITTGETARCERALKIGNNGVTINTNSELHWNSKITGGRLTKTGSGELALRVGNDFSELVIQKGTVHLTSDEGLPGKKVIFEGGTLKCHDDGNSYSQITFPLVVEAGQRGTLEVDPRCDYRNTLTGAGTLNLNIPWIRTDFNGDWSEFAGTLNIMESSWFRDFNTFGYGKAKIYLAEEAAYTAIFNQSVKIGTLTGRGKIGGASSWIIGSRNEDFTFSGVIESGSLNKEGTGTMSLTGANTYSGVTYVSDGTLLALNGSGSATGSGSVYVKKGGSFGGSGSISGLVYVQAGGTLYGGNPKYYTSSLSVKSVNLRNDGIYYVKTNPANSKCNTIKVEDTFNANGQLVMSAAVEGAYSNGQSFKIVSASSITGAFTSVSPEEPGEGLEWDFSEFNTSGIVKVALATGLRENSLREGLRVYPNPTSGILNIELASVTKSYTVQVVSLQGVLLESTVISGLSQFSIDMSKYEKGIYLVKIINQDSSNITKVVLE